MKEEYREDIASIARILKNSKHAVFFGGAGVSTESGIPDFRGEKGLYKGGESKEYYLSHGCLFGEPERFYDFYRKKMLFLMLSRMPHILHWRSWSKWAYLRRCSLKI